MANGVYTFPGEVEIDDIEFYTRAGEKLVITDLVVEINLFEDIFSNTMSGNIVIDDAAGLMTKFLILGQEEIFINYRTPTIAGDIKKKFYVYKMTDRMFANKRSNNYILHIISKESILSINKKLSRSYKGPISETVLKVFKEIKTEGSPDPDIEETSNQYTFISAYWTPFETINWLARRALNKSNVPNYLFYEDSEGFKFKSVQRLMNSPIKREFIYGDINTSSQENAELANAMSKVRGIHQDTSFDYLRRLTSGLYGGRLATLDLTNKNVELTKYDYIDDYKQSEHLEQFPIVDDTLIRRKIASLYFIDKNSKRFTESNDQLYDKWFLQNNSFMEQLNMFKFTLEVFGSTTVKAGDTIDFTINGFDEFTKADRNEIVDKYYSGKYLITAIRHRFRANEHIMFLEIIKDSLAKQIK